jgi:magnesium chelatase family protein
MSLAVVHSRAQVGLEAPPVAVEVHLANGLPALNIVGLPEAEVKEAKDRVRAAILNAQFEFRRGASPSTSRPPTCPRKARASTCRSRSGCWSPRDR